MYKLVVVALAASAAVSAASRDIKNHDHDAANLVAKSDDKELELSVSLGHLRGTVSALSDLAAAENHVRTTSHALPPTTLPPTIKQPQKLKLALGRRQ